MKGVSNEVALLQVHEQSSFEEIVEVVRTERCVGIASETCVSGWCETDHWTPPSAHGKIYERKLLVRSDK